MQTTHQGPNMQKDIASPIILEHQTSLNAAIQILSGRIFRPCQENPLGGDSGLNAFKGAENTIKINYIMALDLLLYLNGWDPAKSRKVYRSIQIF